MYIKDATLGGKVDAIIEFRDGRDGAIEVKISDDESIDVVKKVY